MRFSCLGIWLALCLGSVPAVAQPHLHGYAGTSRHGELFIVDSGGRVTTIKVGTSVSYGCVMDRTNRLLVVSNADGQLIRVDPKTGVVLGPLAVGLFGVMDVVVDLNGDYYATGPGLVWRVTDPGEVTTVARGLGLPEGGLVVDVDTGELIVQSRYPDVMFYRQERAGNRLRVLAAGADARYGITQDILTADLYSGTCCGDFKNAANIDVLPVGADVIERWLTGVGDPAGVYSLRADRASAAARRLIAGAFSQSSMPSRGGGLYAVDLATKSVTRLTVALPSLYETEILYRRNLYTVRTEQQGLWHLGLAIPEDAGRGFVLLVSLSGVRPGHRFPDGRTVALNLDVVTLTGLLFGLQPHVSANSGVLDGEGRAQIDLDFAAFGPVTTSPPFWFVALTLDSAAPQGVKTITDPLVFRVENRP